MRQLKELDNKLSKEDLIFKRMADLAAEKEIYRIKSGGLQFVDRAYIPYIFKDNLR